MNRLEYNTLYAIKLVALSVDKKYEECLYYLHGCSTEELSEKYSGKFLNYDAGGGYLLKIRIMSIERNYNYRIFAKTMQPHESIIRRIMIEGFL